VEAASGRTADIVCRSFVIQISSGRPRPRHSPLKYPSNRSEKEVHRDAGATGPIWSGRKVPSVKPASAQLAQVYQTVRLAEAVAFHAQ
jgi:hypothetical protein